jgi:hypothetical protein
VKKWSPSGSTLNNGTLIIDSDKALGNTELTAWSVFSVASCSKKMRALGEFQLLVAQIFTDQLPRTESPYPRSAELAAEAILPAFLKQPIVILESSRVFE